LLSHHHAVSHLDLSLDRKQTVDVHVLPIATIMSDQGCLYFVLNH